MASCVLKYLFPGSSSSSSSSSSTSTSTSTSCSSSSACIWSARGRRGKMRLLSVARSLVSHQVEEPSRQRIIEPSASMLAAR